LAAVQAAYPVGAMMLVDGWAKYYVRSWTSWNIKANTTFVWTGVENYAKVEFPGWAGYDVVELGPERMVPNLWGLIHMHGNVAEWCADSWDGISDLATGAAKAGWRAVRGGSWRRGAVFARSAARDLRQAEVQTPMLIKRFDRNRDGAVANDETDLMGSYTLPGYDDVGFRFIIPVP